MVDGGGTGGMFEGGVGGTEGAADGTPGGVGTEDGGIGIAPVVGAFACPGIGGGTFVAYDAEIGGGGMFCALNIG